MPSLKHAVAVAALVIIVSPGTARAASAHVVVPVDGGTRFFYAADPGEANDVHASLSTGIVTIHDSGAVIAPGDGCTSVDPHEVSCDVGINDVLDVRLGDLADNFVLEGGGGGWSIDGGSGADMLLDACSTGCGFLDGRGGSDTLTGRGIAGGAGDDTLTGTAKSDSISGGAGNDELSGNGGNDDLDAGAGDDAVHGGAGRDSLWVDSPGPAGVTVDLRTGVATGEGTDSLTGIEDLIGSRFDDRFSGNSDANRFDGQGGDDLLMGRGGDDVLDGNCCSRGDDRLHGGRGSDRLRGGKGHDLLVGGPGGDKLSGQAGDDVFRAKDDARDRLSGGPGLDNARVDQSLDLWEQIESVFF